MAAELRLGMRLGRDPVARMADARRLGEGPVLAVQDRAAVEEVFARRQRDGMVGAEAIEEVFGRLGVRVRESDRAKRLELWMRWPRVDAPPSEGKHEGKHEGKSDSAPGDDGEAGDADERTLPQEDGEDEDVTDEDETDTEAEGKSANAGGLGYQIARDEFVDIVCSLYAPHYAYGGELARAVARGDIESAEELVARGCDPAAADGSGLTALHVACEAGCVEAAKWLLNKLPEGAIDAQDARGWSPLVCAAANNRVSAVELLKLKKANLLLANAAGRTALHWAVAKGHLETSKALLAQGGAALARAADARGLTALHMAVLGDEDALCALLLKSGASAEQRDAYGRSARDYCMDPARAERLLGAPSKKK